MDNKVWRDLAFRSTNGNGVVAGFNDMSKPIRWLCLLGAIGVAVLLAFNYYNARREKESLQEVGQLLQKTLQQGAYRETLRVAKEVVRDDPKQGDIAYLGALAAVQLKKFDDALRLVEIAIDRGATRDVEFDQLWSFKGIVLFSMNRPSDAEAAYREALRINPENRAARNRLAFLLMLCGHGWETFPWRVDAIRHNVIRREDLVVLASHQEFLPISEMLERFQTSRSDDLITLLGLARLAMEQGERERAKELLRGVVARRNDHVAWAALGELLLEEEDGEEALSAWHRSLPDACESYPGIWIVRGMWAQRRADWAGAARCFGEAVRRDPTDRIAVTRFVACLAAAGERTQAAPLSAYVQDLEELVSRATAMRQVMGTPESIERLALLCERLGRYWEADGWARWLLRAEPPTAEQLKVADPEARIAADRAARVTLRKLRHRIAEKLEPELPQVDPALDPSRRVDIRRLPMPNFSRLPSADRKHLAADLERTPSFTDVSAAAGIDFQYLNTDDASTPGRRIFESTGGGVAVLDYDQDGYPDIYFTQSCPWPVRADETRYRDRLYRNRGDGRFEEVTARAGLGDTRYSQGVSAGDFDNDGWPDLLVANIGGNRLYHNNGDGTFSDVTVAAGVVFDAWTTSCMICDVDGDGNPDLYDVNYLQGEKAFQLICKRGGIAGICSPHEFESAQDQLWRSRGDGSFENIARRAGIVSDRGKGLGIVAGDLTGTGEVAIFIANDTTPNSLFVRQAATERRGMFRDEAVLRGVAYDREGNSQGCMGVGADDADGDGRIDLFVTNFYRESNAFYRQLEGGMFLEESDRWRLRSPSLLVLGFGTQFLDAELDGLPDLIVANGHIDDYGGQEPLEMQPQYYRNVGGRFAEWPADRLGPFFTRKYLGRGLALIDYNRDGREDFVVSHIGAKAALVENRSANPGHFLAVDLVATRSARDGFATRVTVEAGRFRRVRQLVAGSGYQASNERQLVFGLGKHERIDRLTVRWPSGKEEVYEGLAVDRRVKLVELRGLW